MSEKEIRSKRINMSVTDLEYERIVAAAKERNLSTSNYCVQAVCNTFYGSQIIQPKKVEQPREVIISPVEIYTQDIQDGLNKIGTISSKLDRLIYTLSQKNSIADYEIEKLGKLITDLKEAEYDFNTHMATVYEERAKIRKEIMKKINKQLKGQE